MAVSLKDIGLEPVEESDFEHEFREIVVKCDECGHTTTTTTHFFLR